MTIHDFDMARFLLGEVVEVQATGANLIEPYIAEAGDIDSAVVVLRGAGGELCQIVNSRRCSFGYDQRLEAFGAEGMLTAGNQVATSVRRSGAAGTETAPPYLNFFLDRYQQAYKSKLERKASRYDDLRPWYRKDPRLRLPGHHPSSHLRPSESHPADAQRPTAGCLRRQSTTDPLR